MDTETRVSRGSGSQLRKSDSFTDGIKPVEDLEAALASLSLRNDKKTTDVLESHLPGTTCDAIVACTPVQETKLPVDHALLFADDVEPLEECVKPLRRYQSKLVRKVSRVADKFYQSSEKTVQSTLVYLPTGGGKTRIAAELIRSAVLKGHRCLFVVNRNKLATQAADAMHAIGLRRCTALYKSGFEECLDKPVQIASLQSLRSESREYPDAQLVIIDEAHCAVSESCLQLCRHYKGNHAFIVGLTATPMRLDPTETLSTVFDKLIKGPSITELVAQNVVVPPLVHFVSAEVVRSSLKSKRTKKGPEGCETTPLSDILRTDEMVEQAVVAWRGLCRDRKTVCFCVDVEHAKAVAAAFVSNGIRAHHIDGSTPEKERNRIFAGFDSGRIAVLTSVNVLSEGFDQPDVSAVMLLRPTQSKGMYIQMVGRGLRSCKGKSDCIVLDQSGNTVVHGPIIGPSGYVPEPWGDDDPESTSATARPKHKLWKLRACAGDCGAMLHSSISLCPKCLVARQELKRAPLGDRTNVPPVPASKPSCSSTENCGDEAEIMIPRREKPTPSSS